MAVEQETPKPSWQLFVGFMACINKDQQGVLKLAGNTSGFTRLDMVCNERKLFANVIGEFSTTFGHMP